MARHPHASTLILLAGLLASTAPLAAGTALDLPAIRVDGQLGDEHDSDLHTPLDTGSRLGLSPLQTPASTTRLDGDSLRARNARSAQDAVSRTPGISFIGTPGDGGTGLAARGFSGHASVMQLFDGIRLYTGMGSTTFPTDPWQLDGLEVLRGPASSLYGEGATGAVVNYLSKKPFEGDIHNRLRLGYGSSDRNQLGLDSGGSLNESLSYRATLNRQASNGWVDRGDSRSLSFGAALRWQANDNLAFTLAHDQGDQEPNTYFGTPLIAGHYRQSLREKNHNLRDAEQRYRDQWTRLTSEWTLGGQVQASNQLYYLKTRRHWRNAEAYSWDDARQQLLRGDYLRIAHVQEQLGDRQTFAFDHHLFGLPSRTLLGSEVNRIRFHLTNNSPYDDIGDDWIDPWSPAPGYFQSASAYRPHSRSQTRTFALFAENQLQLGERWSLITGARRDQVHIERDDLRADTRSERSLSGGNWRAGLVYALTPNASLYGQYGTSKDGVNNLITLNPSQQQMQLSQARQSELGFKQRFWEGRGEWTLAGYHIVKKKLLTSDPLTRQAQQIGQQSSDGIEASLALRLPDDWNLTANAAVLRAEFDKFYERGQSRAGNRPSNVPRRTANLWLDKGLPGDLRIGTGLRYVDNRYADAANQVEVPGYTVADANLSWQVTPALILGLELNNLFDRQYAVSQTNGGQQWFLGEPRSFLLTTDIAF